MTLPNSSSVNYRLMNEFPISTAIVFQSNYLPISHPNRPSSHKGAFNNYCVCCCWLIDCPLDNCLAGGGRAVLSCLSLFRNQYLVELTINCNRLSGYRTSELRSAHSPNYKTAPQQHHQQHFTALIELNFAGHVHLPNIAV